jgi:cell shape-determining protein MreD
VTLDVSHRRTLVIVLCGFILLQLVGMSNHALAPARLYLWLGGLFVAFAGLRLPPLIGLLLDAVTPVPFGLHAFLFGIAQLVLVRIRHRFAATETLVAVTVALLTNLALFLALAFLYLGDAPEPTAAGLRMLMDLLISQCVLALIAPWFFALQTRALEITGSGLRIEASESI